MGPKKEDKKGKPEPEPELAEGEEPPPPPPPMEHDVVFTLSVEATPIPPPTPPPKEVPAEGDAAAEGEDGDKKEGEEEEVEEPPKDPSHHIALAFTIWGEGAPELKSEEPIVTHVVGPEIPGPEVPGAKEGEPPTPGPPLPGPPVPVAFSWSKQHPQLVNEAFARAMCEPTSFEPAPPPPEGEEEGAPIPGPPAELRVGLLVTPVAKPEEGTGEVEGSVSVDCSAMLVGDTEVSVTWDEKALAGVLPGFQKLVVKLTTTAPVEEPPPPAKGEEAKEPEPLPPPLPRPVLADGLAARLNPLVLRPLRAKYLPDMPATREQLDEVCEPIWLRYAFHCLPQDEPKTQEVSKVDPWVLGDISVTHPNGMDFPSTRTATFGRADVVLLGDLPQDALYEACMDANFEIQVHDRTSLQEDLGIPVVPPLEDSDDEGKEPEPVPDKPGSRGGKKGAAAPPPPKDEPPPPKEGEEGGEGGEAGEEEVEELPPEDPSPVYGLAKFSLQSLCRGVTSMKLRSPLQPATTLRGGGDLEWKTRPGRYHQAGSVLTLSVRTAKPITRSEAELPYERAVLVMDYRDTELFQQLDSIVHHANAKALDLSGSPMHVLQTLVTMKFTEEQRNDESLDLLTGFQLIDKEMRLIVLEGLRDGAMKKVEACAIAALAEKQSNTLKGGKIGRRVLLNRELRYSHRMYDAMGAVLKPIKLRNSMSYINADAHTFPSQRVRAQTKEGLRRLAALRDARWMRQGDRMHLLPTSDQMNFIEKKFAGELTLDDLEGVKDSSSTAGSSRSRQSRRQSGRNSYAASRRSSVLTSEPGEEDFEGSDDEAHGRMRRETFKEALDSGLNKEYLYLRAQREAERAGRNFHKEYLAWLGELRGVAATVRQGWQTWNVLRRDHAGTVTFAGGELHLPEGATLPAGTFGEGEGAGAGKEGGEEGKGEEGEAQGPSMIYDHPSPFLWPYPRAPEELKAIPNRPTTARRGELREKWVEPLKVNIGREPVDADIPWREVMPAGDLFGKDPEYWKTVHLSGDGLAAEMAEQIAAERAAWDAKVVVSDVNFHAVLKLRKVVTHTDRNELVLKDPPSKKGFKMTHVPPATQSIFLEESFKETDMGALLRKDQPHLFTGGIKGDFQRNIHIHRGDAWKPYSTVTGTSNPTYLGNTYRNSTKKEAPKGKAF